MTTYLSLFIISFLAATLFPLSSEITLASLLSVSEHNPYTLIGTASLGNILGSVFNWLLGFYLFKYIKKKWFPFKENQINDAAERLNKFGVWSLLFAWVPIIGDPLTLVAGLLRVKFVEFLILVTIGKVSRYLIIFYLLS